MDCIQINRETTVQLFKLPKDMIDYLWERIDVAKKKEDKPEGNPSRLHISFIQT